MKRLRLVCEFFFSTSSRVSPMRSTFATALLMTVVTSGLLAACSVDFDADEPDTFACDDDNDCTGNYECVEGFCSSPQADDNDVGTDTDTDNGNGPDEECVPEEVDGYPDDHLDNDEYPLDVQEVCDGHDNNCDGYVDVIFCEDDDDCPDDQEDPYGVELNLRCDTDLEFSQFTGFDEPTCFARSNITVGEECYPPRECIDGEYEPVHPDCGGVPEDERNDENNDENNED